MTVELVGGRAGVSYLSWSSWDLEFQEKTQNFLEFRRIQKRLENGASQEDLVGLGTTKLRGEGRGCGHICDHQTEWRRGSCGKWWQIGFG